eukprot:g1612.t1
MSLRASSAVLILLLAVRSTISCSLARPKGFKATRIGIDSDKGLLDRGKVRLELTEYARDNGDDVVVRTMQAVFDIHTGDLQKHDSDMEFMPRMLGYVHDTAEGSPIDASGETNVSWSSLGLGTSVSGRPGSTSASQHFSLPNAKRAMWWFSDSLDKIFAVYQIDDGTLNLATCSHETGTCLYEVWSPSPQVVFSWPEYPSSNAAHILTWDEERLVGLPLMCCICKDHEFFTYRLTELGKLALNAVSALNMGAESITAYDTLQKEVWEASGHTGDDGQITVRQESYADGVASTMPTQTISDAKLVAFFGGSYTDNGESDYDEGVSTRSFRFPTWVIATMIAGAMLVLA